MENALQAVVNTHLDRLTPGTTVDAMEAFAFSVPTDVIGDLLGVPHADREQLRVWWEAFLTRQEGEVAMPAAAIEANRMISEYIGDLIEARRTDPGDDLISIVLRATFDDPEAGGQRSLTPHEVLMFCQPAVGGGVGDHAEADLQRAGRAARASRPVAADRQRPQPDSRRGQRGAALRHPQPLGGPHADPPGRETRGHHGCRRVGAAAAGQRQPRRAPLRGPRRFVLDRPRGTDVYFGWGIHICLGQWLARREAQLVFEYIAEKIPELHHRCPRAGADRDRAGLYQRRDDAEIAGGC